MINKNMSENETPLQVEEIEVKPVKNPDEVSGMQVQAHVKIFDPETEEIYFAGRA